MRIKPFIIASTICLFLSIGYLTYKHKTNMGTLVNFNETGTLLMNKTHALQKEEAKNYEWLQTISKEEFGYLPETSDKDVATIFKRPINLVIYMFAAATNNDADAFMSLFHPETLISDLQAVDEIDKTKVIEDLMQKILRDQEVQDIGIIKEKKKGREANIVFKVIYSDGKQFTLDVDMELQSDNHHNDISIYFITTSVLDIVNQIEKKNKIGRKDETEHYIVRPKFLKTELKDITYFMTNMLCPFS